ncbi:MAG: helix-turn-helix transcriptional regulator [Verrucomicrobiota bacterium]
MSTVAEQLRHAREAQHLTVHQVAELTKIRTDHIRALEEGNYDMFAATVYIRGFVRAYATLVKLDVAQLMTVLAAELAQTTKFREHPKLTKAQPHRWLDAFMLQLSSVNWRLVLLLLLLAVITAAGIWGYRTWHNNRTQDPLRQLGPGLYQPKQSTGGEVLPLSTNVPKK